MTTIDYASETNFTNKIESYLKKAKDGGFLNPKTIVVLPEYLGSWLVVAGEKKSVFDRSSIADAMQILVLSNIGLFVKNWVFAKGEDSVRDTVFRMKSGQMASIYSNTFSFLAKKYSITIVAGSILLPEPFVEDGILKLGNGALRNGSFVFLPDGKVSSDFSSKIYPIEDEKPFVKASSLQELKVIPTPAGRIGVLVCADSWYPEVYETFKKQNVDFIVVPSFVSPSGAMSEKWRGYNGSPNPIDVQKGDIGTITEGEAWWKYALAGRISKSGASHGINVFLRGSLWDLGSDGEIIFVSRSIRKEFAKNEAASMANVWVD